MTHLSRLTTPTPADLGALKTAAWKAFRLVGKTSLRSDADAADAAARAVEEAEELYRVAHVPNALKVFVICDHEIGQPLSVYAVFASGPECIYEEPRGARCDCGQTVLRPGEFSSWSGDVQHSDTACVPSPIGALS